MTPEQKAKEWLRLNKFNDVNPVPFRAWLRGLIEYHPLNRALVFASELQGLTEKQACLKMFELNGVAQ